jgi:hypothetical protein
VCEAGRHSESVLGIAVLLHCSVEESYDMKIESLDEKDKMDLSEYFGALKDSPLLDEIEADSRKIRELAKPRTCFLNFETEATLHHFHSCLPGNECRDSCYMKNNNSPQPER